MRSKKPTGILTLIPRTIWFIYILANSIVITNAQTFIPILKDNEKISTDCKLTKTLAEKFTTGCFELKDIPKYITYLTDHILVIVTSMAILFVIYGGYQYIMSPISEDKEAGKKTIFHAILGLTVAILAYVIINTALWLVTSE